MGLLSLLGDINAALNRSSEGKQTTKDETIRRIVRGSHGDRETVHFHTTNDTAIQKQPDQNSSQ